MNPTPADLERLDNEQNPPGITDAGGKFHPVVYPAKPAPPDPMAMVAAAIEKGMDPQKILDFIERMKKTEDQEKYARAMIACQKAMPIVVHDSNNAHTKSTYAKLETIQEKIKPIYTQHGFTLSWGEVESNKPGYARVTCDVIHEGGHIQRVIGDYPLDGSGAKGGGVMSPIQGRVSSNTYAQRDMVRSIFNVTIVGMDWDGAATGGLCSDEQIQMIRDLLDALDRAKYNLDLNRWLKWLKAEKVESILMADFDKAVLDLNQRRKEKRS